MNCIHLHQVTPHIFADRDLSHSDVWQQDLTLEKGKSYLVEAMSGTGKSSLCSYLLGFRNDFTGTILFDNTPTSSFKVRDWVEIRRCRLSHLFQELRLFPELTAYENIEIKNRLTHHLPPQRIKEWFERLDIADKLQSPVGRLSFGQQQRVALVRALAQPFDFLLVDEPVSHLDDLRSAAMGAIISEEVQKQGAGLIVTSIGKHIHLPYDRQLHL